MSQTILYLSAFHLFSYSENLILLENAEGLDSELSQDCCPFALLNLTRHIPWLEMSRAQNMDCDPLGEDGSWKLRHIVAIDPNVFTNQLPPHSHAEDRIVLHQSLHSFHHSIPDPHSHNRKLPLQPISPRKPLLTVFAPSTSHIHQIHMAPSFTPTSPTAQQRCPNCQPATTLFQPAGWHPRFCFRHQIKPDRNANTRFFKSEDIKNGFKGLLYGGLRFGNDRVSLFALNDKQRQALRSWNRVQLPLGLSISTPFRLMPVFDIYNDYLFCGALHGRVNVVWVDDCPKAGQKGFTVDAPGPLHCATISIKRPGAVVHTTWTPHLVKESLETLLHEMIHALFNLYECRCATCTMGENQASNTGVQGSGHGPDWRNWDRQSRKRLLRCLGDLRDWRGGVIWMWKGGVARMWRK